MHVKPIIFSAPMIRALLEGKKSQTRRVLKNCGRFPEFRGPGGCADDPECWGWMDGETGEHIGIVPSSDGVYARHWSGGFTLGQILWVREGLQMGFDTRTPICHATYASDGSDLDMTPEGAVQWAETRKRNTIPSIHMPRWASRLTLEVTEVRVERLQEMEGQHPSESDAIAEGVNAIHHGDGAYYYSAFRNEPHPKNWCNPTDAFRELWNSLHGPEAWDANPWVAAITFTTHHKNVDQLLAEREAA